MTESEFLRALRALPLHPGAGGLRDDCARLGGLTLTTDTLVEGVHFLSDDPPGDVAWKLIAVNLSDLAAHGARPVALMLNYPLSGDAWDTAFLRGLGEALTAYDCTLLGGDTVSLPQAAPRVLSVTAIGEAGVANPARSGARAGDLLYVTGTIGDAGAGLRIAQGESGPSALLAAYRRPVPRVAQGCALAPVVHAMMDVSDGVLIDAERMAAASGLGVTVDLALIPLSAAYRDFCGEDGAARQAAATAGDDYQLLFAAAPDCVPPVPATVIGQFAAGAGLSLVDDGVAVPVPTQLGFEHRR